MYFRIKRIIRRLSQNLSVRAGLFCVGAVGVALVAVPFSPYVPDELAELLGGDAVDKVLTILATSMLAVVTFSLSTLIASYSVAASSAPSRATAIILRDSSAQIALSTFLGAFIFSIVSLVALSTGYYGPKGRVILFGVTICVLAAVIWTIIKWIGQLSGIGQLANVINEIETAGLKSIERQRHLFSNDPPPTPPANARAVQSHTTGFVQTIDLESVEEFVKSFGGEIWIEVNAGQFVYPGLTLFRVSDFEGCTKEKIEQIRSCFFIGKRRTFEDDPRFGLIVLSEISSRALSPAINDPGTAIEIITSQLRLVSEIQRVLQAPPTTETAANVHLRSITPQEILDDAFRSISRDAAGMVEVGIFLQKALRGINGFPHFQKAAEEASSISLREFEGALTSPEDIERLKRAAAWNVGQGRKV